MGANDSAILEAVDISILDTIEAFIRFRPGFHGDTGMRDYLYHRLMTRLPGRGLFAQDAEYGTLLAQAEWYTTLKYRRTGQGSSRGRFDIGIPLPQDLALADPRPLVAFECGRNKRARGLVADVEAGEDHDGPEPADITKLAREIGFAGLPYGYALEFYDEDRSEAQTLIRLLRGWALPMPSDYLRVVVLVLVVGNNPMLTFFPDAWALSVRERFSPELDSIERLICKDQRGGNTRTIGTGRSNGNRVPREAFLSSCSAQTRELIKVVSETFGDRVKLIYGCNTMTVNRHPSGKLFRIHKASESISEVDPVISENLARLLCLCNRTSTYRIERTDQFRSAVVNSVAQVVTALPKIAMHLAPASPHLVVAPEQS